MTFGSAMLVHEPQVDKGEECISIFSPCGTLLVESRQTSDHMLPTIICVPKHPE